MQNFRLFVIDHGKYPKMKIKWHLIVCKVSNKIIENVIVNQWKINEC